MFPRSTKLDGHWRGTVNCGDIFGGDLQRVKQNPPLACVYHPRYVSLNVKQGALVGTCHNQPRCEREEEMDRASTVAGFIAASLYFVRSGAYSITTTYGDLYPSSSPSYYVTVPSAYSSTTSDCIGVYVSDGWCDLGNNNAECDWDGGDVSLVEYARLWLPVLQGHADGLKDDVVCL